MIDTVRLVMMETKQSKTKREETRRGKERGVNAKIARR